MPNPAADLVRQMEMIVGAAYAHSTPADQAAYLRDWSTTGSGSALCVVRPADASEVSAVMSYCAAHAIPVVPQGGLTGMVGGAMPRSTGDEVVINLSRMNRILDIAPLNDTLTVEAGCVLQTIKDAAEQAGRFFPLALGSQGSCEIGGNIATNAGGLNVIRYGNTRNLVLGLEIVLPDGSILDLMRSLRKDNTGYDLKNLFIGSEGTLGIITKAILKLHPMMQASATAWIGIESPQAAIELLAFLRARVGERITSFELINRYALDLVLKHHPGSRDPLQASCAWYVLTEWSDSVASVDLAALMDDTLGSAFETELILDAAIGASIDQVRDFWRLREHITEAQRMEGAVAKHDISVPISSVPAFLAQAADTVGEVGHIVAFGHVGDGNIHYNIVQPGGKSADAFKRDMTDLSRRLYHLTSTLNGSISAEHGLGQLKSAEAFSYRGPNELEVMRRIKHALDPLGLLNPGKLLPLKQRY